MGYWNAECLSVWISTDLDGNDVNTAVWKELTENFNGISKTPENGYGESFVSANSCDLSAYDGQTVRNAFIMRVTGRIKRARSTGSTTS